MQALLDIASAAILAWYGLAVAAFTLIIAGKRIARFRRGSRDQDCNNAILRDGMSKTLSKQRSPAPVSRPDG
jgi:hypothetical protein